MTYRDRIGAMLTAVALATGMATHAAAVSAVAACAPPWPAAFIGGLYPTPSLAGSAAAKGLIPRVLHSPELPARAAHPSPQDRA
jgi:hypothetical protein